MESPTENSKSQQILAQKLRLRRALMAVGAGLANSLVLLVAWYFGYVFLEIKSLVIYYIISSLGYFSFPWLIATKRNLHFADPSLTSWQIGWQISLFVFCMYVAPGIRELFIINFVLIMFFGVFRYQPRHFLVLSWFLACSYFGVVAAQFFWGTLPLHWQHELITGLVFVLALIFVNLLGAEIVTLRMALKRRNAHLAAVTAKNQQLAITDDLTGLFNRRHLMRILQRQKSLAARGGYSFSLAFIDLDYFKQVNDTYGHAAGDKALQLVAQSLLNSVRDIDYVARIGGEEFVVVLVQTDYSQALRMAERLRADLQSLTVTVENSATPLTLTASLGVASYHVEDTVNSLLSRADAAAYMAKKCGRNCLVGEQELPASMQPVLLDEDEEEPAEVELYFAAKL